MHMQMWMSFFSCLFMGFVYDRHAVNLLCIEKDLIIKYLSEKFSCRALLGEEDDEVKVVEQHQSVSQKQRDESYTRLKKLLEDGFEMVTNIRVAGDAREISRRLEEEEARRQR